MFSTVRVSVDWQQRCYPFVPSFQNLQQQAFALAATDFDLTAIGQRQLANHADCRGDFPDLIQIDDGLARNLSWAGSSSSTIMVLKSGTKVASHTLTLRSPFCIRMTNALIEGYHISLL
jgi:hypothetical protein